MHDTLPHGRTSREMKTFECRVEDFFRSTETSDDTRDERCNLVLQPVSIQLGSQSKGKQKQKVANNLILFKYDFFFLARVENERMKRASMNCGYNGRGIATPGK